MRNSPIARVTALACSHSHYFVYSYLVDHTLQINSKKFKKHNYHTIECSIELRIMDVLEVIKSRRSVRAFKKNDVSERQIMKLIDAARQAPSAGNIQPWEFVIVKDSKRKHQLSVAALNQTFIKKAPVVIVVCANETRSKLGYGNRGVNLYCIQDTAAAIENLLLVAHAMDLGACWVGAFREEIARNVLNTPAHVRPVAIIPIGHPSKKPTTRSRRPLEDIIHRETF
jgi:nitroreductase